MCQERPVTLIDLILCLSRAMDLINAGIMDHHMKVAYVAMCLASRMKLPLEQQKELLLAGALHDCGALSLKEKMSLLDFDVPSQHPHQERGYRLVQSFEPLAAIASIIRHHHTPWEYGEGSVKGGEKVPDGSFILHLADRVAVLARSEEEILGQVPAICRKLRKKSGSLLKPEVVEALMSFADREFFWFDLISPSLESIIRNSLRFDMMELGTDDLLSLARLFSKIIDFRSPFTATHSSGVAASAGAIGRRMGLPEEEVAVMEIAGYLHDIGKLAVPPEILEAPRSLTEKEFNVIRSHVYHTYRILHPLKNLRGISLWAAFHHEHLDGSGYPFHLDSIQLSPAARILAVADVFTAITEDRPYRQGMLKQRALAILQTMAVEEKLDSHVVSSVNDHYEEIYGIRRHAQEQARLEFNSMHPQAA